jgi:hypothetical protein
MKKTKPDVPPAPELPRGFLDQKLLTPKQAAEKLQLHPVTLVNWRVQSHRTGKLWGPPWLKIGWKIRYPQHLLEKFVQDSLVDPSQAA